jgi:non-canonical (house-cleaning) NTP pyrophosphatase
VEKEMRRMKINITVGSTNPFKIQAVKEAFQEMLGSGDVRGPHVESGYCC